MQYLEILNKGNQILRANNIKSSNLDCELILSKVLNKSRESTSQYRRETNYVAFK